MANQVKLIKIDTNGLVEMDTSADEITLLSFTVTGGGPVLSGSGLDMNDTDISDVQDLAFVDPSTGTINQTAGAVIVDDLMAKERNNTMTTAGEILFPTVTDVSGEVDNFQVPTLAGAPTASPTNAGAGFLIYDSTGKSMWVWTGTEWDNMNTVASANNLDNNFLSDAAFLIRSAVYISSANHVSAAKADAFATSKVIGCATIAATAAEETIPVRSFGILGGFSGLTAGAAYYLSAATAGAITATIPTGSGNSVIEIGVAKSTTELFVNPQIIIRRAA